MRHPALLHLIFALGLASCATSLAPNRPPVTAGSDLTFYPDACKDRGGVDGDLTINGSKGLAKLSSTVCITGSLIIEASPLTEVVLPRLSEIGGDLIIRDNGKLTKVDLPLLRLVGGAALFLNLPQLTAVALPELTVVGDHLIFGRHADLDAAMSMSSPGSNLSGLNLPVLQAVGGAVVFRNNPALESFELPKLDYVEDGLIVDTNAKLSGFQIANDAEIFRTLEFTDNSLLTSLKGIQGRTVLQGDLRISGHPGLRSLQDLSALQTIQGGFFLENNPRLGDIAMPALESLGGDIEILAHEIVSQISWPMLKEVGGAVEISGNNSLTTVTFEGLEKVGGNLDITANFGLTKVDVDALTAIAGDLGAVDNPALTRIAAASLLTIGNNLVVTTNAGLKAIDLPQLTTVTGYVTIQDNPALTQLTAPLTTKIGVKLFVRDNVQLPECAAIVLRNQLKAERPLWGEDIGNNGKREVCD
jgi:hypothetical protein